MPDGELCRYCLVQYSFKGGIEHPIRQHSHGNAKTSQQYVRTWSSTKSLVQNNCTQAKPREVLYKTVSEDLGGIEGCISVGQVPRNRQQVKDFTRNTLKENERKNLSRQGGTDDPWYRLLSECKSQASKPSTAFIRDVRVAPEPLCIMTTNRQLNDLKRFCCSPVEYRPFTVDPTFDIGEFNVTPITYQHLLLENRRDGSHPSFIGPVLLHEKKTTETYSTFSGSLRTQEPDLRDLMAFGTDDEKALITGFKINFDRSINLQCEIHLKKNIEKKLQDFGITGKVKGDFVADIFGRKIGSVQENGLIDAENQEKFDIMLVNSKEKWLTSHPNGLSFYEWFCEHKRQEFVTSAISPVRQRAGLGCPPERFTTNRSEQTNRLIQDFTRSETNERKKVDEFAFCVSLRKLVNTQRQEIELALLGRGEYKLREQFKFIEVSPQQWSKMQEGQKTKALEKVHLVTLEQASCSLTAGISEELERSEDPLLNEMQNAGIDWIPHDILLSTIQKARSLTKKVWRRYNTGTRHASGCFVIKSTQASHCKYIF